MKTLVAAMLLGSVLAGGCAMVGDEDERPENPWRAVALSEERLAFERFTEASVTEYESVRLLYRKAQAECAKYGRRAGAPSPGVFSVEFAKPCITPTGIDTCAVGVVRRSVPCLVVGGCKEPEQDKDRALFHERRKGTPQSSMCSAVGLVAR